MRTITFFALLLTTIMASAQTFITISARGETARARLAETEAASILASKLASGPITISLSEYGGFEMVGTLPFSLPADDRQITTSAGDIMLYLGNNIVFFYGSNSWAYTPLGKIEGMSDSEISRFFQGSGITVTLALEPSSISEVENDRPVDRAIFDLSGRQVFPPLSPGIYIIDGRKTYID